VVRAQNDADGDGDGGGDDEPTTAIPHRRSQLVFFLSFLVF